MSTSARLAEVQHFSRISRLVRPWPPQSVPGSVSAPRLPGSPALFPFRLPASGSLLPGCSQAPAPMTPGLSHTIPLVGASTQRCSACKSPSGALRLRKVAAQRPAAAGYRGVPSRSSRRPLLLPAGPARGHAPPRRGTRRALHFWAFLGIFANQLFYIFGLRMTAAINAAILTPRTSSLCGALAWARAQAHDAPPGPRRRRSPSPGSLAMLDLSRLPPPAGNLCGGTPPLAANCIVYAPSTSCSEACSCAYPRSRLSPGPSGFGGLSVLLVSAPT